MLESELGDKKAQNNPWEEIGFFKPIAGFWYNLFFTLINLALGAIISGVFLNYLLPFPESMGYRTAIMGIFVLMFTIFDLGTHMVIDRYIAETRIKDPDRMMKLIQYFIWYQMCTGLVQTTAISVYALFVVPETELAYGIWIMLIAASLQYPGFLGVFHAILQSLQHFNKTAILGFIHGEIFQRITEVGFILLGKWYGENNPQIGMIMGIAIGAAIGTYVDDFIAMILGAYFFADVMKNQGISVKRCFMVEFSWNDVKEPFFFGLKTGLPGLMGAFTGFLSLWLSLRYIPQYTTFSTLFAFASTFIWVIATAIPQMVPLFSESFLNGKKKLAEFYVKQSFRFIYLTFGIFISIFLLILTILENILLEWGLVNYLLIIPLIIPLLCKNLITFSNALGDQIIIGTDNPNFLMKVRIVEDTIKILFTFSFLVWLQIPQQMGFTGIIIVFVFMDLPAILIKMTIVFLYLNRNVVKIRLSVMQTFGAPFLAALCSYGIGLFAKRWIFDSLYSNYGLGVAIIPFIAIILCLALFVYFPLTMVFGGWDEEAVETFEKVVGMTGPSKFLVKPMFFLIRKAMKISPLYNRFPIESDAAKQEAQELYQMKLNKMFSI